MANRFNVSVSGDIKGFPSDIRMLDILECNRVDLLRFGRVTTRPRTIKITEATGKTIRTRGVITCAVKIERKGKGSEITSFSASAKIKGENVPLEVATKRAGKGIGMLSQDRGVIIEGLLRQTFGLIDPKLAFAKTASASALRLQESESRAQTAEEKLAAALAEIEELKASTRATLEASA